MSDQQEAYQKKMDKVKAQLESEAEQRAKADQELEKQLKDM